MPRQGELVFTLKLRRKEDLRRLTKLCLGLEASRGLKPSREQIKPLRNKQLPCQRCSGKLFPKATCPQGWLGASGGQALQKVWCLNACAVGMVSSFPLGKRVLDVLLMWISLGFPWRAGFLNLFLRLFESVSFVFCHFEDRFSHDLLDFFFFSPNLSFLFLD